MTSDINCTLKMAYISDGLGVMLKMLFKFICILRITFCDTQLCGRCLVNMTPVVKVLIHCVFALLLHYYK